MMTAPVFVGLVVRVLANGRIALEAVLSAQVEAWLLAWPLLLLGLWQPPPLHHQVQERQECSVVLQEDEFQSNAAEPLYCWVEADRGSP